MKILIINGVNLNMTGIREKSVYGTESLIDIENFLKEYASEKGIYLDFYQSDIEGELASKICSSRNNYDALIINAGAYSHYSYAIRDAITASELPAIEVHLSNVFCREEFRQKSALAAVCKGYISGLGKYSYKAAIDYFFEVIK